MDKEVLVSQMLTEEMIEAGKTVVLQLDKMNVIISSAMWFYVPESKQWRLVLATPEFRTEGPRRMYKKIQSALTKLLDPKLQLHYITVINSDDPLINLLRTAIRTGPGIASVRFSRNVINGVPIEDAFIYRMS